MEGRGGGKRKEMDWKRGRREGGEDEGGERWGGWEREERGMGGMRKGEG